MPTLRPDEILEVLAGGMFDALLGTSEHDAVECKAAPYRINEERERSELAKDVSGLANASGGLILIGVGTRREEATREDIIRSVSPFARNLIDVEQYHQILASIVYPPLQNVQFRWFDSGFGDGRGTIAAVVPPQPAKPYLVATTFNEAGRRVEALVGYFERRRAGVEHMSVQRLQTLLRDGSRFDEMLRDRLDDIERLIMRRNQDVGQNAVPPIPVRERIAETVTAAQLPRGPVYVLAASPDVPLALRGFERRNSDLAQLVAEPPRIRPHGFDLGAEREAHLVRGELLRSRLPGWKTLDVWRDGFVVFAAAGNEDFLCWGRRGLRINPLVLAETCYLFAELARSVFGLAEVVPQTVDFRLEIHDAIGEVGTLALPTFQLGALRGEVQQQPAPQSDREFVVRHAHDVPPGVIAFTLIRELYLWFGYRQEEMPYIRTQDGVTEIDRNTFVRPDGP